MKKKPLILISTMIISITGLITLCNIKHNYKSNALTIEAKILLVEPNYLLVTTDNNLDYIVKTNDTNYNIGDKIKLELKEIDKSKTPIEAIAKSLTIIKNNNDTKENIQTNETITENANKTNNNQNITEEENTNKQITNETNVIAYFEDLDKELTSYNDNDKTLSKKVKSKFVTCIDFIFYDKEISGTTFKQLTNYTKLKVLDILLSIDSKIDSKFPNYKENINENYKDIKNKIIEKYLNVTTNTCNEDEELCTRAKENFQKLKNTFGITWSMVKNLVTQGTTKLKDWYEIWRYN